MIARPAWRELALACALGAVAALGQAPLGWWLAPMLALGLALRFAEGPALAWRAFAAGTGYGMAALPWIVEPFFVDPEIYGWMAPFALVLMGLGMGAFWAVCIGLGGRFGGRAGAVLGLLGSELARGYLFTGFPWALLGHSFIDTPLGQLGAYIGGYGLSALLLALVWIERHPPYWGRQRELVGGLLSAGIFAALWAFGAHQLQRPMPADTAQSVRLVQANAPQALKWHPDHALPLFERHLALIARPLGQGAQLYTTEALAELPKIAQEPRPALTILPETAVPFWLDEPGPGLEMSARAARAPLLLGLQRAEGSLYFNSLALLGEAGEILDVYDKYHLVPFGEYMPFGNALDRIGISAFAAQAGNGYTAGAGPRLLDLGPLGHAAPLICYEAIFPQHLRALPARPDWLLQATNDAWFGTHIGPQQHLAQMRLRAIEQGLPLLRAANTGISAVIDARGRLRATLPMNTSGVIDTALPAALPEPFYARWGDGPLLGIFAALALALALRRKTH